MGTYPKEWDKHLEGIGRREYNMVHFTPLMERGESNSPYSMYDQIQFDQNIFPRGEEDVAAVLNRMEADYGLLGLTDVVWNHTANNSKWLEEHPEAGYNLETCPWLESAFELDSALLRFGEALEQHGLPTTIQNMGDLERVIAGITEHVVGPLKLWEYYIADASGNAEAAVQEWAAQGDSAPHHRSIVEPELDDLDGVESWSLQQKVQFMLEKGFIGAEGLGPRHHRRVNTRTAAAMLVKLHGRYEAGQSNRSAATSTMIDIVNEINVRFYGEYDADVAVIQQQLHDRIRYLRLDHDGPKLGVISKSSPLIETYFTRLPVNATTEKHNQKSLSLVNNGWIWAANALKDHAGSDSRSYLRREVIVWSDCVKLRYGRSSTDNPFLWDFMTKYTQLMARHFAGFRIDNCHSTPITVAEYLLDKAREIRPNLAVFAELFTGSEEMDYFFVKRLGISALIREAMQAWSTQELSRLVHMHGGRPIGSFEVDEIYASDTITNDTPKAAGGKANLTNGFKLSSPERIHRIKKTAVHALFMDCTHDNEVPAQKRDARDTLPNAALVSMCACATGSVMGYDEIYPRLLNIVQEQRTYTSASSDGPVNIGPGKGGIGGIKKLLNKLHTVMGKDGYSETFIHHEGEYITIHRVNPLTRKGIFCVAHTAFPGYGNGHGSLSPVHLGGTVAKSIGCWTLNVDVSDSAKDACFADTNYLYGLPSEVSNLEDVQVNVKERETVLTLPSVFPPGSIALFETSIPSAEHSDGIDMFVTTGAAEAFSDLDLIDLNFVLYRCEPEERDASGGEDGVYTIPDHGPLVYAGLQGWWSVLKVVVRNNDLGHPICNNLRDGQWALDYVVSRLQRIAKREQRPSIHKAAAWLSGRFDAIRKIPNFLLPRYFALVIQTAYNASWGQAMRLLGTNIQHGQTFLQELAMTSVQMTGYTKSASLYPLKSVPCLSAGLPHFSSSWARCWGRDVFISLRGLYLATGRYDDAKEHIMAFASVLKHGMVPNLLNGGKNPRYNSRDSVWFFLQNVQDYTKIVPNGVSILQEKVSRRFLPYDDTFFEFDDPRAYSTQSTIAEIIQEALQRHASGLSFREANAGDSLDKQMKWEGFKIDISVDWSNGMIYGGNQYNCGTWMDKMGESENAGNKGYPGTPRDGAPIELTALLYSTLMWVFQLHIDSNYRWSSVKKANDQTISFEDWAMKIRQRFEKCYYVPVNPEDDAQYDVDSSIINRRGIYKDLHRSGKPYEDYQLRANFPIAMTVAPELFNPDYALRALEIADTVIRGPTGIATLDPSDLNYHPYYNNSEDSTDFATSKGRNYHQGPEWLWPTGFFLRAMLKFDLMRRTTAEGRTEAFQQITRRLAGCKKAIEESPWAGLAELTNKNGEFCGDSVSTCSLPILLYHRTLTE